ncbi:Mu transposase C-terminal domain-containing protein [Chitinophaga sp. Hz27]|uniref:Mu transposase C-terminal domain-containing protein n=1 Tax=Chitinophaga sp. Hz27 TaxID=3347169 RepID=UPI0035D979AB
MKFDTQNRLCMEGHEFIRTSQSPEGLVPKGTYDSLKRRNRIEVLERGGNGRSVLIIYESLPDNYKQLVVEKYGNPYVYVAKQPLLQLIRKDIKAESFFLEYRYEEHKCLPTNHVSTYTQVASWLNMLLEMRDNKRKVKKQLGLTMEEFWKVVLEMIVVQNIPLPHSYRRLAQKLNTYQQGGYETLIDWRFGNRNSVKVKDELAEAVLFELISHPNQHDDVVITAAYNKWAVQNAYPSISSGTVGNYRRNNQYQLQLFREGNAAWYHQFGRQTKRNRPSAPLLLVGSDDNDIDLYFRDEQLNQQGKLHVQYYHRFKAVIISDAFNDYPLGYCYADGISTELVKMAYLDAMHHIYTLTGAWYLPHQLQTDRWNLKALLPFYQSIDGDYFPASAKSPRGKYIERSFGKHWHQHLRRFQNYAGNNITSDFRLNPDHIATTKAQFPHKDEGFEILETFIDGLRQETDSKTGMSRQDVWKAAFMASEKSKERCISDEHLLRLFGVRHEFTNTITNGGIRLTIQGKPYEYQIPDELYLQHVGRKIQVIYDPMDLSRVLVTDDHQLRFMAHTYKKLPSARADYQPGDKERLFRLLQQKKAMVQGIIDRKKDRAAILAENQTDAAGLLQAQVMVKEARQAAENLALHPPVLPSENFDPLDLM